MSGRISDIIIHPKNENIWHVTAGSEEFGRLKILEQHGIQYLIVKKLFNWMHNNGSAK